MTNAIILKNPLILTYLKDFAGGSRNAFFIYHPTTDEFKETSIEELINLDSLVITHDFWAIAASIYKTTTIVKTVFLDVREFSRATRGYRPSENPIDTESIIDGLSTHEDDYHNLDKYQKIYYKKIDWCLETYKSTSRIIFKKFHSNLTLAKQNNEISRYFDIELPVFNYIWSSICKGIKIDKTKLRIFKSQVEDDYFWELKQWGCDFNLPFEVPKNQFLIEYLENKGFDLSEVSLDFILEYIPIENDFGRRTIELQKLDRSRRILSDISQKYSRTYCIADVFGTITSRIIYKNPSLQNLAKRYRDIIIPDHGKSIWYIDFSQFETAIIAVTSQDSILLRMYKEDDLYKQAALAIFGDEARRKDAKRLFLSYAYGMRIQSLADAAQNLGGVRTNASCFFRQFSQFSEWKESIYKNLENNKKIGTSNGNFMIRNAASKLTPKEQRSAVSQVIQGTASLIFKTLLLKLRDDHDFQLLLPMHDAVLFQYPEGRDVSHIKECFERTFSEFFENQIEIKATVSNRFQ